MAFARERHVLAEQEMSAEEFRAWLRQFDGDRDGRISREELRRALRSLHAWFAWWKARRAMRAADADRDGFIADDDEEEMNRLIAYANRHLRMRIYQYDSSS